MEISLKGKTALITGGSRGIGKTIVETLVKAGADVIVVCILKDALEQLKSDLPSVQTIHLDLTNWKETEKILTELKAVNCLVNNAGIADCQGVGEVTEEGFDKVFNINVKALINVSQIISKKMIASNIRGSIVNIASYVSQKMYPSAINYCTSKIAVDHITRAFAKSLAKNGIRVNSVNPYIVNTELGQFFAKLLSDTEPPEKVPLNGRYLETDEVAKAVLFFLSDFSSMITGETLRIDGGKFLD